MIDALSRVTGPVAKRAVFDGWQAIVTPGVSAASGTPMTLIEAAPVPCTGPRQGDQRPVRHRQRCGGGVSPASRLPAVALGIADRITPRLATLFDRGRFHSLPARRTRPRGLGPAGGLRLRPSAQARTGIVSSPRPRRSGRR